MIDSDHQTIEKLSVGILIIEINVMFLGYYNILRDIIIWSEKGVKNHAFIDVFNNLDLEI